MILVIRYDLVRSIWNLKFFAVILAVAFLFIISQEQVLLGIMTGSFSGFHDVVTVFTNILIFDRYRSVIILLLCSIYTASICDDIHYHYLEEILNRITLKQYIVSKVLANSISVSLAYMGGFFIYLMIMLRFYPMVHMESIIHTKEIFLMYKKFPIETHPFLLLFHESVVLVLSILVLSIAGMLVSVYIQDRFVAYGVPFILNFLLGCVTYYFPPILDSISYTNPMILLPRQPWYINWFYKCGVNLVWILILAILLYRTVGKRWYCEEST